MRRFLLFVLPMIVLLSGCKGESAKDKLEKITQLYAAKPGFTARARITTELTDRKYEFMLDWNAGGGVSYMTVAEPAELAGLSAETGDEGLTFKYDDLTLVVDPAGDLISPIEALPELLYDWSGGLCLDRTSELLDGVQTLCVTYSHDRGGRELINKVWFESESHIPLKAEIYSEDRLTLEVTFLLFEFT